MSSKAQLPSYEPMLAAYHRAFAVEACAMIEVLPIAAGQTVLDMACGDGVYSPWLAERVGPAGRVVAVDMRSKYLVLAREDAANSPLCGIIDYGAASIDALPFDDHSFDVCWVRREFVQLARSGARAKALRRVTKPGGSVAVLEGDTLHRVILPWPPELEVSVHAAELEALRRTSNKPGKYYVGRQLRRVFREAGLEQVEARNLRDRSNVTAGGRRTDLLHRVPCKCRTSSLEPTCRTPPRRAQPPGRPEIARVLAR